MLRQWASSSSFNRKQAIFIYEKITDRKTAGTTCFARRPNAVTRSRPATRKHVFLRQLSYLYPVLSAPDLTCIVVLDCQLPHPANVRESTRRYKGPDNKQEATPHMEREASAGTVPIAYTVVHNTQASTHVNTKRTETRTESIQTDFIMLDFSCKN